MFDRLDGCEYVFVWRTSEACPVRKAKGENTPHRKKVSSILKNLIIYIIVSSPGENCQVRDPRSGYEFNLSSLKGRDYPVHSGKYVYHLSVCEGLKRGVCTQADTGSDMVSSCQAEGNTHKIAGAELG